MFYPRVFGKNPMDAEYLQGFFLGDLLFEPLKGTVSGKNHSEHLPPTAAEVLVCLARRPGDIVSHDELLEEVWGNGNGSREALSHAIGEIRRALNDHFDDPRFIQTLPTHGYRLVIDPVLRNDAGSRLESQLMKGPRWWQALLRHGVVQAAIAYGFGGWLLIQVADATEDVLPLSWLSKKFVVFTVIIGLPILIALSWFLEFYEGRVHADDGNQSGGLLQGLEQNYIAIFIAYGIGAIGAASYDMLFGFDVAEPGAGGLPLIAAAEALPIAENSVAVLRLASFDTDPEAKAFTDGLSDDILDGLSRIPGLSVPSRGDTWSLPEYASSEEIRRRLRVAHYIEGSVRFLDDSLRVVVQFIDSETGTHRFSRDFEIDIGSIGDMQREITELVVANLKLAVDESIIAAVAYEDAGLNKDAYLYYQLGREAMFLPRSEENFEEAIDHFNTALTYDADYPAAHAGLCDAFVSLFQLSEDTAFLDSASAACARAESIAPRLPVVLQSVAHLYQITGRLAEAEQLYATALDMNDQDVVALRGLANIRQREQRNDEAEHLMRRANELQPGNWQAIYQLGNMYYEMGRYADASAEYRKALFLDPDNFATLNNLSAANMMQGDFDGARGALQRALEIQEDPTLIANLALTYYYTGDYDAAVEQYRRAIKVAPKSVANRIGLLIHSMPSDASGKRCRNMKPPEISRSNTWKPCPMMSRLSITSPGRRPWVATSTRPRRQHIVPWSSIPVITTHTTTTRSST